MSSDQIPFRSEVMGWSPQQLADFLRRRNLTGCDKAVLKNSISGSRFVNLSDNDLEKFPTLQAPLIAKISTEIGKKEAPGLFRKKLSKFHEPDTASDVQGWGDDEFDDEEFDDDYERPCSGDVEGSESSNDDLDGGNDYEPPPSVPSEDLLCPTLPIGDGDYIDRKDMSSRCPPPPVCPRPPVSTMCAPVPQMPREPTSSRRDHSPHSGGGPSGKFPPEPPQVFRGTKPVREDRLGTHLRTPKPDVPNPPTWSKPPVPPPSSISNSSARPTPNRFDMRREQTHDEASKLSTSPLRNKSLPSRPVFPGLPSHRGDSSLPLTVTSRGSLTLNLRSAMTEERGNFVDRQSRRLPPSQIPSTQGLDPSWYVGKVTRGQAKRCLTKLHKDGAYLVRDSTKQLATQPFTLMVFYQDKVYNIQIRQQNQQFLLGTGLKAQEAFPSVSDIIGHYSQCPLLLVDAKNCNSSQHNQCLLSYPAGYHTTQQNWS